MGMPYSVESPGEETVNDPSVILSLDTNMAASKRSESL